MRRKYVKQFILWILDIAIICLPILLLSFRARAYIDAIDTLERFVLFLAIHQFLAFVINKNFLDAHKDELLTYKCFLELLILYAENPHEFLKSKIVSRYEELQNPKYFISDKIKICMKNAMIIFDDINGSAIAGLKAELINTEQRYEHESLAWKQTLLLKFLK